MQKTSLVNALSLMFISATLSAAPIASENFNSRKGAPLHEVRSRLQNSCWTFHHFDVNKNGWDPRIEGDGAMVSEPGAIQFNNAGIYTPLLNIAADLEVSFDYKFNENFSASSKRWLRICLADAQNQVVQVLEELQVNGANAGTLKNYSTEFRNLVPGEYRLVLLYGGNGGTATVAIDELNTSATLKYESGCHVAPMALKEKITGTDNRTAAGTLIESIPGEAVKAFLVKNSPDGTVVVQPDGAFRFTPKAGFRGRSTSFVYRICSDGGANLCSLPTTMRINFPGGSRLVEFKGSYKRDGNVLLLWNTASGSTFNKFEIERSLDGHNWENSGVVFASQPNSRNNYTYTDKVKKNTALKKDLYYRLRQTDGDGTVTMSKLMVLRVYNTKTVTMISVTPSPARKDIAVNVQLMQDSYVSMRLRDNSGSTILKQIVDASKGLNTLLLEGSSSISPGLYMLELIVNSKERMLVKLIKE